MMVAVPTTGELTERGVRLTRLFDAPPELVFKVWSDPRHLDAWWGPDGFRNETQSMEFAPGGEWRYTMHGPDGVDFPNRIAYQEVEWPARLRFTHDSGEVNDPGAMQVTVTFEAEQGGTRVTMHTEFASADMRDKIIEEYNAIEGGQQTFERLAQYLADSAA
jgi:uncharacterized protein YndB with AHSA1/START domain